MKKLASLIFAATSLNVVNAQITITSTDMPNAGDNIKVSITNTATGNTPATSGANHTWNYSNLNPTAQRQEIFQSPSTFVSPYNLLFNVLNTSYGKDNYTITTLPFPGVKITAAYDFYKESSSDLRQIGAGYVVNAAPLPFLFTSPDIIYKFPLNYLNVDSSNYQFGLPIPTVGYYGQTGKRVNTVDGWGTLTTPYGTFQTLRLKSAITATDTIFLTSLNVGSKIPRPLKHEYKWLAAGQKIPVLQIDVNVTGTTETITSIVYRDSLRSVPQVGISEIAASDNNVLIYPNPTNSDAFIHYQLYKETNVELSIIDVLGKTISKTSFENENAGIYIKELSVKEFAKGIYFVKINFNNSSITKKIIIK